ncbi:cathepsin l-like proteinase [Phtheirospermum japonicum]|uniref:Cathepsin l-like proteinase n=1 Tax=Phtheirospermum japonicum TaxID=374723 RepID=A0A830BJ24_9LAMI|nr:cathepsin l-like proteinase [Phtheirospermum japonicum]
MLPKSRASHLDPPLNFIRYSSTDNQNHTSPAAHMATTGGRCNYAPRDACYAFALTDVLYGETSLYGNPVQGSVQQLIDHLHVSTPGETIPKTGYPSNYRKAFRYVQDQGLYTEAQYPFEREYRGHDLPRTDPDFKLYTGEPVYLAGGGDQVEVLRQLHTQPLAGAVLLTPEFNTWRTDAIYTGGTEAEARGSHAVTILGYGTENGVDYLLCQTSFGSGWGYKGFVKVARHLVRQIFYSKESRVVDGAKRKSCDEPSGSASKKPKP